MSDKEFTQRRQESQGAKEEDLTFFFFASWLLSALA
jgi:hypothetical protein